MNHTTLVIQKVIEYVRTQCPDIVISRRSNLTIEEYEALRLTTDTETWDALESNWEGTAQELIEACKLVSR